MVKNGTPSDNQLEKYGSTVTKPFLLTTSNGAPIHNKNAVLTVGKRGPMLMQDVVFMDEMAHFDRERIPERVVHAKGAGAHGYFEVTHDVTKYCKADLFNKIGKQTPVFVRFSTVAGEAGSSDTARDPRGFAVKFYTEEGNWDIVGNNTPIFFIRDPILFPNFVHTQKRNPQTNLKDHNAVFDFWSLRPESMHQVMFVLSDRGIPDGFRHMHGYGSHTFKLVNKDGNPVYCKFHFRCQQGIKNLPVDKACHLSADDPDYATRDLFNSIENGNYPAWELNIQVMTFEQAEKSPFNPFDVTKVWPQGEYPLIPVGRMVLNRNPKNYFAEVEQSAFCPAHVVPGVEFSPDRMLQGRIFSYTDTHFHRLGPNNAQLPINCPFRSRPHNTQRAGLHTYDSQNEAPNYHPNSFAPLTQCPNAAESKFNLTGDVGRFDDGSEDNFSQPRVFWTKVLCTDARKRLVNNIFDKIKDVHPCVQDRFIKNCNEVHADFGGRLRQMVDDHKAKMEHKHHM